MIETRPGRPAPAAASPQQRGNSLTSRQYVRFAFYSLDPAWRRLPAHKQADHKQELLDIFAGFNRRILVRPYSLVGTRADAEILFWQVAEHLEPIHDFATAILGSSLGAYLTLSASYLSQTKRSIYEIRDLPGEDEDRLIISPSEAKYLFVYPFVKTRPWYMLSMEERQVMMDEHIRVGRKYPAVKLNTTYSYGLDDQEFVVAFETDEPADFLDLVQDLRETQASVYTLRDTPLYACLRMEFDEALDALGGPKIAKPRDAAATRTPVRSAVCRLEDVAPGQQKVVFYNNQQIALFNIDGRIYAINNRCPHARGPLSAGAVEANADNCTVTCPWHYAKFDLTTGNVVDGVAASGVQAYRAEVENGEIFLTPVEYSAAVAE